MSKLLSQDAETLLKAIIEKDTGDGWIVSMDFPNTIFDKHSANDELKDGRYIKSSNFQGLHKFGCQLTSAGKHYFTNKNHIQLKEAMDMFVPLPEHLKNSLLEIVSKHKVNEKFEPNQEEENIIKQLQSAGYLSNFKFDIIGNCNVDYRYEDINYLFLEQEYNKHMPKAAHTFINNGGQMGVGFDNAIVNVVQNNGISLQDLLPYIENIKQAIQEEIDPEDQETAINSIDIILSELESGNPNEKNVKSHFKLLSKIGGGIKVASSCCTLLTFADKVYPFLQNLSTWFQGLL